MKNKVMRKKSRIIAMILVIIMLLNIVPLELMVTVGAADSELYALEINGVTAEKGIIEIQTNNDVPADEVENRQFTSGTQVGVSIRPTGNYKIQSIAINGEDIEKDNYFNVYSFNRQFEMNEHITIDVVFEKSCNIIISTNGNGQVKINESVNHNCYYEAIENEELCIEIEPNQEYKIKTIRFNGEEQIIENDGFFRIDYIVTDDLSIEVEFSIKDYVFEVAFNENGTITTTPKCEGGRVDVSSGQEVQIEAIPNENYRVSKVIKNDEEYVYGDNDAQYSDDEKIQGDLKYVITFSPNRFTLTKNQAEITTDYERVEYDGSVRVTIVPENNKYVSEIIVNSEKISEGDVEFDGQIITFEIDHITENITIDATFMSIVSTTSDRITSNIENAIRKSSDENENIYIFAKDDDVIFETKEDGLQINHTGSRIESRYIINESILINNIIIYTKEEEALFSTPWIVALDKPIQIVFDEKKPDVSINVEKPNKNDYYNKDIKAQITVTDKDYPSGLSQVEYWVISNGVRTQGIGVGKDKNEGILYSYNAEEGVKDNFIRTITIDAAKNNSDDTQLWVKTTDRAGNENTQSSSVLKINSKKPTVKIELNGEKSGEAEEGYFNVGRKATIIIVDEKGTFDEKAVVDGINIIATDAMENPIAISKEDMLGKWVHSGNTHSVDIEFKEDANYEWSFSYVNRAGSTNEAFEMTGESPEKFTIDTIKPEGKILFEENIWDEILRSISFGIWKNSAISPSAEVSDLISPIRPIVYYKSNGDEILTAIQLNELYHAGEFSTEKYTVETNEKFVVYARLADFAGNVSYICTDGLIYDNTDGVIEMNAEDSNAAGYYNKDVEINISVTEEHMEGAIYSGIKSIDLKVESEGIVTKNERLFLFANSNPTYEELTKNWNDTITISSVENNSDDVVVTISVQDNAGNQYEKQIELAINIDKPTIHVSVDKTANAIYDGRGYFSEERTATIIIIDRETSFDAQEATNGIFIDAKDSEGNTIEIDKESMISQWVSEGNEHTATVRFFADANYKWSIYYINKAGNIADSYAVENATGEAPNRFTIDTEKPSGTVLINDYVWDKMLNKLTFGLYDNLVAGHTKISATATDTISPIVIEYFKTSKNIAMTESELDKQMFLPFKEFVIDDNEQFVVYLRISDYAKNYIYLSSDGYIIDKMESSIDIQLDEPNEKGIYNSDISANISIEENEIYSGIKTIEYWVESNGVETQRQMLYHFDYKRDLESTNNGGSLTIRDLALGKDNESEYANEVPTHEMLRKSWAGSIVIDAILNNHCNTVLHVETVDNAGNVNIKSVELDIDCTSPQISVEYDNNKDNAGNGYFNAIRVATIKINERTSHFDPIAATEGIVITAVDAKGMVVEIDRTSMISKWTTIEGKTANEAVQMATITYNQDANYTFSIQYTDMAGNKNDLVDVTKMVAPYQFTIDRVSPNGSILAISKEGKEEERESLIEQLTFGFWSSEEITVSAMVDDKTSLIDRVEYYKTNHSSALKKNDLDTITNWQPYSKISVKENEQFTVYLRIVDKAGNYTYISTDGLIVDDTSPREEMIAPMITINPQQPINDLYNGDVTVDIVVDDPLAGGTYSGLKMVKYRVLNSGVETQNGTLYEMKNATPTRDELQKTWSGKILVDSKLNNSNDIVIEVYAEDNSLNVSKDISSIKIDTTAPVIHVKYDNNSPINGSFYKNDRIATISISERNFDAKDVKITVTNKDGTIPVVSAWNETKGNGNFDNTVHTATITYNADGDYTFAIEYTDLANNQCEKAFYENGTTNPIEFTIDKTLPRITVVYDNNRVENEQYFDAIRTATVTIVEHNFDINSVLLTQSKNAPVAEWSHNGDVHTATFSYKEDGDYAFNVTVNDIAGNQNAEIDYSNAKAANAFTIDTIIEKPIILIDGENGNKKAYADLIVLEIAHEDINYQDYEITLVKMGNDGNVVDVTKDFIVNTIETETGIEGTFNTFDKTKENEGIYTLTVAASDKAGNRATESIVFSLNRFGSTYSLAEETLKINGTFTKEEKDVTIKEINANKLENIKITLFKNNETIVLKQDVDFKVDIKGGDGEWYEYTYTIFAKNFEADGVYKINIHSEDEARNIAENTLDTKNVEVQFGIDKTNPTVVVTNLQNGKTYPVASHTVIFSVNDNLKMNAVILYLDGEAAKKWSGKELEELISQSNGEIQFEILGDSTEAHNVKIVCVDEAGNETIEEVTRFYVTTNMWVRYYNNKLLFWGSIIGTSSILIGIIVLLIMRRKKKNQAK